MSLTASLDLASINAQLDRLTATAHTAARKAAQAGAQVYHDEVRARVPVSAKIAATKTLATAYDLGYTAPVCEKNTDTGLASRQLQAQQPRPAIGSGFFISTRRVARRHGSSYDGAVWGTRKGAPVPVPGTPTRTALSPRIGVWGGGIPTVRTGAIMANTLSAPARILTLPTGLTAPVPAQRMPAGRPRLNVVRLRHPRTSRAAPVPTLEDVLIQELDKEIAGHQGCIEVLQKTIRDIEMKIVSAQCRVLQALDTKNRRIRVAH